MTFRRALQCTAFRANLVDTTMVASCTYPTIKRYCADRGYRGTFIYDAYTFLNCRVDISDNIKSGKRWIVERTFAWMNNSRQGI